jgi:dTDP-4-amino-4,6-dideoxygalactose transaminase|tara:strand:+ start:3096 stop:4199 length:1104 start_codon:yes stop_codon:yes gene_type:complete
MFVPFNDLTRIHKPIIKDSLRVFEKIVNESQFVLNSYVKEFENDFAKYTNQKYAISCANGTDAIELILRALDIGKGDEVILPTNSYIATSTAVSRAGATPIFVDNDKFYLINCTEVEKYINKKTKAIIAVNLYGQMANLKSLSRISKKADIYLIEDAAQSHGAEDCYGKKVGDYSVAASYSFYPGKNLGAWGDGGAVTTNSKKIANKITALRSHGSEKKYIHKYQGFNSRLQPFQGYVLSEKLKELHKWNSERNEIAETYTKSLSTTKNISLPQIFDENKHVWHLYVIRVKNRNSFIDNALKEGVELSIHYPIPIHKQMAYQKHHQHESKIENAQNYAKNLVTLPIFPKMKKTEINKVIKTVQKLTL